MDLLITPDELCSPPKKRAIPSNAVRTVLMLGLFAVVSPSHAESVTARGEYLYGPETSESDACRLAEERAKASALGRIFGESISMEEQVSCRETRGSRSDYNCEMNRVSWSSIEGEIRAVTINQRSTESRVGARACLVTITADIVMPDRRPDSNFDLKVSINGKMYREGESLTIQLEPTVPMHVAIFNWAPYLGKDVVTRIFPNSMDLQNYITQKVDIPTGERATPYSFKLTWLDTLPKNRSFVDEYLIVIGTKSPITWLSSYEIADFKTRLREIPLDERRVVKRGYQLIRKMDRLAPL